MPTDRDNMLQIRVSTPAAAAFVAVVLLFATGGPVSEVAYGTNATASAQAQTAARGSSYLATHLYFGTGRHNGEPPITDDQFMKFVADVITPRFPSGLTVQQGRGQWRDKTGSINREISYELTVLYPAREAHTHDPDIEYIRRLYCAMYGLESVGRADVKAQADF
ncbi:DUF3574 domain-containing protein [Streptomyces violascens]|uniref:DUF3574 domain-containing protein n=1 Tax=Streptomyces violascens TaxID=67381 RepID=A0ABQ3QH31_9ACTN|nr:DUF3574 domain-containing protein [Streptomyces violascens]GGT90977.1 hypothetical protein GCM10010289_09090 [Streptomyces violascens]GHI36574.1 hypothetical protein Sviol_09820 [Streptomyces violascens]